MIKEEVTIYDIARELGISASTVSRALSGAKGINDQTRKKVRQRAEEMGYRLNSFAANLRSGNSRTIGVIVHRLDSPFVATFLAGAEKSASQKGYNLLIAQSFEDVDKEIANTHMMLDKRVDGLMVALAKNSNDTRHFRPFINYNIPLVFFDRIDPQIETPCFVIDNYQAAVKTTAHLIEQQCKNILHVTVNSDNYVYAERIRGFSSTAGEAGVKSDVLKLKVLDFNSGRELAVQMTRLNQLPDGVFFANDISAVGFITGLNEQNIPVPRQVAVAGFNNDISSLVVNPNLTTIDYPAFEMGTMVANHLIEHILGNTNLNMTNQIVLKSELIVRASTLRLTH